MSQSKRNNIIFYSILALIVILSISGTIFAIYKHNKNVNKEGLTNTSKEEIKPYLTFKEVSESKKIDVFKEYPINPIKINHESNNKVTISGLKDKEIERKVNEKLSVLNAKQDKNGNNLFTIEFNMSNVLSITAEDKTVNINLVTGEEITLEEVFNKGTDLYSILVKSIYNNLCQWEGCYTNYDWLEDDYEWSSQVENTAIDDLKRIKNNEYSIEVNEKSVNLVYSEQFDDYRKVTPIEFYDFYNEVTIYDRYLDESIYENKVTEYCTIGSCRKRINDSDKDYYEDGYYLNDKTYLEININNNTNIDPFYNIYSKDRVKLNLKDYVKMFQEEIIKKEGLSLEGNNYNNISMYIDIYYHTSNDYIVTYSVYNDEYKKEEFTKYRLGLIEAKTIREKSIYRINMLLDKNNKITYLSDNPSRDLKDFETKLYEYIMDMLKDETNNDFTGYNTCEFSEDEDCENKRDYHNLIKEASYAIDTVNNRLNIYEMKPGIAMAESYVNTSVSLDIFKDKPINKIKEINKTEAIELFEQKGTHFLYIDSDNCSECKNLEFELNSIGKGLSITINNLHLNNSDNYEELFSKLDLETTIENEKSTYGEFLKTNKSNPVVIIIKDGKMIDGFIGYKEANDIAPLFQKYL